MPLTLRPEQQRRLVQYLTMVLNIIVCTIAGMVAPIPELRKDPERYHTSILSGEGWLLELLTGHPERIHTELGMHSEVFKELVSVLRSYGHRNTQSVSLEEQVAIFYIHVSPVCPQGTSVKDFNAQMTRFHGTFYSE